MGEPVEVWQPSDEAVRRSRIVTFSDWLLRRRGIDLSGYDALYEWSVTDLEGFWSAVAEFGDVRFGHPADRVLGARCMPGAEWFPGATLNYAEHALRVPDDPAAGKADDDLAVVFAREDGIERLVTFGQLRAQVAAVAAALVELGVRAGDRVVAFTPNCVETLVAFLATASLGATWSSCSPDFGAAAVHDRFAQIDPVVLFAVDGYHYGGKVFDARPTVERLRVDLPGVRATVLIPYLDGDAELAGTPHPVLRWDELLAKHSGAALAFTQVPFEHPLWVLYSSGTTGLPKGIVQGHGGILLEHVKTLSLQADLRPGERFFWFTTTGWMMWNFLVSGLLVGATIVLYDGSPGYPDLRALWRLAQRHRISYFGTSAPYIHTCQKEGLRPNDEFDLSALRALGSTGSPLSADAFDWIAGAVGAGVQICSVSGGTDLCTAIVGAAPTVPVWRGEISCRQLGAAVQAYNEDGRPVYGEVGELVVTQPMPSMPVAFWNDPDGSRMRAAYYEYFPGVWRHGDWIMITPRGSCVIYGRSDSTLNRGGVRMGTADFYRIVESLPEVLDSLVIDTSGLDVTAGELVCFLVLAPGATLATVEPELRDALRVGLSPRHVPDRFVVIDEVPKTLNGKKCEVPVKKILAGTPVERAVSRDALRNPEALTAFVRLTDQGKPG